MQVRHSFSLAVRRFGAAVPHVARGFCFAGMAARRRHPPGTANSCAALPKPNRRIPATDFQALALLALYCALGACVSGSEFSPNASVTAGGAAAGAQAAAMMSAAPAPAAATGVLQAGAAAQPSGTPRAAAPATPAAPPVQSAAPTLPSSEQSPAQAAAGPVEWTTFNYDNANSRNNRTETKISVANVATLMEKWQRELQAGVSSTPQVMGGKVYVNDHGGSAYMLNAETGAIEWQRRGLYVPRVGTPLVVGDVFYGAGSALMHAMKPSDDSTVWTAQLSTHRSPMIDSSPVRVGDLIVIGVASYEIVTSQTDYTARGSVVAINMADGSEAWRWWSTANNAEEGGGVSVWSSAAYDPELKMIFIGTGNPYEAPPPKTSNALVALASDTGELVWFNQFHPGDIYTQPGGCQGQGEAAPRCDFDIGASPNLFKAQGKDAVGVGSKGGLYRTFERATGTMLWERQLGAGSWWGGVMAVAATDDTTIYVPNNNFQNGENIFALDMNSGDVEWMTPIPSAVWGALTLANGVLFSCGKDGMMRAYEAATGKELKAWDLGRDAASGVAVSDGVVYATSGFTGQGQVNRPGARVSAFSLP